MVGDQKQQKATTENGEDQTEMETNGRNDPGRIKYEWSVAEANYWVVSTFKIDRVETAAPQDKAAAAFADAVEVVMFKRVRGRQWIGNTGLRLFHSQICCTHRDLASER